MATATFRIWRGERGGGGFQDYKTEVTEGMVVLDAVHQIQAADANDLSVRWNCKAGKCGSCSAEINGHPKLMCMTRLNTLDLSEPVTVEPMKTFPHVRDLVTDVSWNYKVKENIRKFKSDPKRAWNAQQADVDRPQEFRKCIECYLCQDVCHVLRDQERQDAFVGPRFMIRLASLEMHPLDQVDRIPAVRENFGSGMCNITRCCTEVCPEHIGITDNAIIPLKERVVDRFYDPVLWLVRQLTGIGSRKKLPVVDGK